MRFVRRHPDLDRQLEDLILSKLVWALESNSEMQRRDIHQLLAGTLDLDSIHKWAPRLGVAELLDELML